MKIHMHKSGWTQNLTSSLLVSALLALFAFTPALAGEFKVGDLKLEQIWSRATPKGARVGAGYLKITNTGTQPDRLISGAVKFAGRVEIHEMKMDGGIMRMRRLQEGLMIPAGGEMILKPGGYHLMFMELNSAIEKGQPFDATLVFEKAGRVDVVFQVSGIGGSAPK